VTLKKCVPAWQKKYIESNACKNIDNINDLANYYGNQQNQEKKDHNKDNQHRDKNSRQGQNHSQKRNHSQHNNKSHYTERNNGNSDHHQQCGSNCRNSRSDPVTVTTKGKETKTETETTTDKIDIDKTTATPNTDTTPANKNDAEKMRNTRLTPTMKAMMDKTLTF
jgi:hypothetical protein